MKQFFQTILLLLIAMIWMVFQTPIGMTAETAIWAPPPLAKLIEEGLINNNEINIIITVAHNASSSMD